MKKEDLKKLFDKIINFIAHMCIIVLTVYYTMDFLYWHQYGFPLIHLMLFIGFYGSIAVIDRYTGLKFGNYFKKMRDKK